MINQIILQNIKKDMLNLIYQKFKLLVLNKFQQLNFKRVIILLVLMELHGKQQIWLLMFQNKLKQNHLT